MSLRSPDNRTKMHRKLKWFWALNVPVVGIMYFTMSERIFLLYISLISVYANVASHWSAEEAAPDPDDDVG